MDGMFQIPRCSTVGAALWTGLCSGVALVRVRRERGERRKREKRNCSNQEGIQFISLVVFLVLRITESTHTHSHTEFWYTCQHHVSYGSRQGILNFRFPSDVFSDSLYSSESTASSLRPQSQPWADFNGNFLFNKPSLHIHGQKVLGRVEL